MDAGTVILCGLDICAPGGFLVDAILFDIYPQFRYALNVFCYGKEWHCAWLPIAVGWHRVARELRK